MNDETKYKTIENMKKNDTQTKENDALEAEGDSVEAVVMRENMHWTHWVWIVPVAIFCSPIGIIGFLWSPYPDYWMLPAAGMMLAIAASAAEGVPNESF